MRRASMHILESRLQSRQRSHDFSSHLNTSTDRKLSQNTQDGNTECPRQHQFSLFALEELTSTCIVNIKPPKKRNHSSISKSSSVSISSGKHDIIGHENDDELHPGYPENSTEESHLVANDENVNIGDSTVQDEPSSGFSRNYGYDG